MQQILFTERCKVSVFAGRNGLLKIRRGFLFPSSRSRISLHGRRRRELDWEHRPFTFVYLWAGWAGITCGINYVSNRGSSDRTFLSELAWIVDSDLSPSHEEKSEVGGLPWPWSPTPSVRLRHVWGGVGKKRSFISSSRTSYTCCPTEYKKCYPGNYFV